MTRAMLFSAVHLHGSPSNGFKPLPLGRRYCTGFSSSVGGQTTLSPATTFLRLIWPLLWPHLHPMSSESPRPPSHGFCRNHWALITVHWLPFFPVGESVQRYLTGEFRKCKSIDQSSANGALESDPVFLHVKVGMTVIVEKRGNWRMADVIHVTSSVRSPRVPRFFQVADVSTGVINWINADLVTSIVPRV